MTISLNPISRLTAIATLPTALLIFSMPISPAFAGNQFDVCLRQLLDSGVERDQAGTACADALIPRELSLCVQRVRENTTISAEDTLKACYRVRRPVDLANCVVDIQSQILTSYTTQKSKTETSSETTAIDSTQTTTDTEPSPSLFALDSCRRSLLPGRHSECVIALSRSVQDMAPTKAMETCLAAEDFPRDLFPSYPQNQ